ncbi:replication initiator [Streptomyces diastatochromogenes]|uniref:replication initiator n=1 Tax=Streptomyces diastatochromogenes TaxID=42236 RepID=UPI00367F4170
MACPGKSVPAAVQDRPRLFVTLAAPSFGPVHRVRDGKRCRPRRDDPRCEHRRSIGCGLIHTDDDPALGRSLCAGRRGTEPTVPPDVITESNWRYVGSGYPRVLPNWPPGSPKALPKVANSPAGQWLTKGGRHECEPKALRAPC